MPRPSDQAARQRLLDLMDPQLPAVLRVFVELGIADHVAAGVTAVEDLAAATDCAPDRLARLLRRLAVEGLVELADGTVALTEVSDLLRRDHPASAAPYAPAREALETWSRLRDGLRAGAPTPHELAHGQSFFERLQQHPEQAAGFDRAMSRRAQMVARSVVAAVELPAGTTVVDLGGGDGTLVRALLGAARDLRAVIFDRPDVVARAATSWQGVDEVELVGGDFFSAVPGHGDVYLMSHILHDWDDADAQRLLEAVAASVPAGTRLLLVEMAAPDDPLADGAAEAADLDLVMLAVTGGKERTRSQWTALLQASGFTLERIVATDGPWSLIETRSR